MVVIQALMGDIICVVHPAVEVAAVAVAVLRAAAVVPVAMGMELTTDQLQQPIMVVQDMVAMVEAMVHMEVTLPLGQVLALVMVVLYMEQVRMVPMAHMRVPMEVVHMAPLAGMVRAGMVQVGMVPMVELEAWVVGVQVAEARAGTTHMENELTVGL